MNRSKFYKSSKFFREKYRLIREIGKGGFSVVYLAETMDVSHKQVAVKVISKKDIQPYHLPYIRKEAEILSKLSTPAHPHIHIVQLYDYFEDPLAFYLVLEYLGGGELLHAINRRQQFGQQYSERDARYFINVLLKTVQFIHSKNIIHRDLKVDNLLLTDSSENAIIKIADFGLAGSFTPRQPKVNDYVGTPAYMAPEIHLGYSYGKEVDAWSIGIIAYALLSGTLPFHHRKETIMVRKILDGALEFRTSAWLSVSPMAKEFIRRLLVTNPNKRMSIDEALAHQWFRLDEVLLSRKKLTIETTAAVLKYAKRWKRRALERVAENVEPSDVEVDNVIEQTTDLEEASIPEAAGEQKDDEITESAEVSIVVDETSGAREIRTESDQGVIFPELESLEGKVDPKFSNSKEEEQPLPVLFTLTGSQGDSYNILEELQKNYFSTIFSGVNTNTQQEVIVEQYDLARLPKPTYQLLQNEIEILTSLLLAADGHIGVVKFYGAVNEGGKCSVIHEKLYGKELLDRITESVSYNEEQVKKWIKALFQTIHCLHSGDIVHRNINPENVVFVSDSYDAEFRLTNFRLAKRLPDSFAHSQQTAGSHVTSYTSPERIRPNAIYNSIEKASDVWSLGVLLHLLLVGKNPFPQYKQEDLMEAITKQEITLKNEDGWSATSDEAKDLVSRLLDKNPLQRLTVDEALNHPWFSTVGIEHEKVLDEIIAQPTIDSNTLEVVREETTAQPPQRELLTCLSNLKKLNVKKKFQRAIHAIIFLGRIKRCLQLKNQATELPALTSVDISTQSEIHQRAEPPATVTSYIFSVFTSIYESFTYSNM